MCNLSRNRCTLPGKYAKNGVASPQPQGTITYGLLCVGLPQTIGEHRYELEQMELGVWLRGSRLDGFGDKLCSSRPLRITDFTNK